MIILSSKLLLLTLGSTIVQAQPPPIDRGNVPPEVIEKFRQGASLKPSWRADTQVITPNAESFVIYNRVIYFDDLQPMTDLLPEDAYVLVNGWQQPGNRHAQIFVHRSQTHPDVRVVLDDRGDLLKATWTDIQTGNVVELLPVSRRTFVQVDEAADIDWNAVEQMGLVRCCHNLYTNE